MKSKMLFKILTNQKLKVLRPRIETKRKTQKELTRIPLEKKKKRPVNNLKSSLSQTKKLKLTNGNHFTMIYSTE